jgi:hypothetical protein
MFGLPVFRALCPSVMNPSLRDLWPPRLQYVQSASWNPFFNKLESLKGKIDCK